MEVIPENYKLNINTNLKTFSYQGHIDITASISKLIRKISLDAKELKIKKVYIEQGALKKELQWSINKKNEKLILDLGKGMKGKVIISIDFIGYNNEGMYGFYRSKYYLKGKEEYILTTQFEAADARAAFPCFDAPEYKATFDLSVVIDNNLDAISNMPIKKIIEKGGRKEVIFYTTPKMSTYLFYIGVGKFEYIEDKIRNITLRAVVTPGKKQFAKLPLFYGKRFIEFYEKYLGIKYPLPKIDFIAIPDFAAGAMENWGAITFRETSFLCDNHTPIANKQSIADTIAHELAHQWFGDLVTMKWWDDLWLNESFATFMSRKAVDEVFPVWNFSVQSLYDSSNGIFTSAFSADQFASTHPINVKVNTPAEINEIFDKISYEKGGSVLYMLENYVGKESFRKGVSLYLKTHSFGNAKKSDLWSAIQKTSPSKQVSRLMSNWIEKPGYPIIKASQSNNSILLKQSRFMLNGTAAGTWPVPASYLSDKKEKILFFDKPEAILKGLKWVKLNAGQTCLYACDYTTDIWERLGNLVKAKKLSDIDSWGVERDLFVKVRSGNENLQYYLDYINSYLIDASYPLNDSILAHINWLFIFGEGLPFQKAIRKTATSFAKLQMEKIGWDKKPNESNINAILRGRFLSSLCMYGDKEASSKALKLFEKVKAGKHIDPNLKLSAYFMAAQAGGKSMYNYFINKYISETLPEEKIRLLSAIGKFQNKALMQEALNFSLSDKVRLQDSFRIPAILCYTQKGKQPVLDWTLKNWKLLMKKFDLGTHMLSRYIENFDMISSDNDIKRIKAFFSCKENMRPDIKREVAILYEKLEANKRFVNNQ
ncbi:MAG: M1 family metallopeptidase [Candidatus Micrarchaeaceae archaeon]